MKTIPFIDLKAQYQALEGPIRAAIESVLNHGQFVMGPEMVELETKLAKFAGCRHALAVSSGTDAAILAMMALGIGPGDEVIVPAFSFIATAETVHLVGATPVYVDVDERTCNLDVRQLEKAWGPKVKAIQPVGLYGQPADMDEINAFAKSRNALVIEDAAQSFGARLGGKVSGALATVGATSFFPAKPLGGYGDGGAVFTDDDAVADRMREIRVHGQRERYRHDRIGINGRLDTLQCAILIPKLERFPWELERRQHRAARYTTAFDAVSGLVTPYVREGRTSSWAQYTLQVPDRDKFQAHCRDRGVPTAVHYPITMADQPAYRELGRRLELTVARRLAERVVSLPLFPDMSDDQQDHVIETVQSFFV